MIKNEKSSDPSAETPATPAKTQTELDAQSSFAKCFLKLEFYQLQWQPFDKNRLL